MLRQERLTPQRRPPCASIKLTLLSFLTPTGRCGTAIFHAVAATIDGDDLRMMQEPVEQRRGEDLILECVIMPLSLIVLLVEAILGAVLHPLLSNIPSRAYLWLADIP